jgi:hypothetical protein
MTDKLSEMLETQIKESVDRAVQQHITAVIDQLILDREWVQRVENLVNQSFVQKFSRLLSTIDVETAIAKHLDQNIERWRDRFMTNFQSRGIHDAAYSLRLKVQDDCVTVDTRVDATGIKITGDADITGALTVQNLVVKGSINTDNRSWDELKEVLIDSVRDSLTPDWRETLVSDVLEISKLRGIAFRDILVDGKPLLRDNTLNGSITSSNLQQLGKIKDLVTTGTTNLNDTLQVIDRRIGINTTDPEMAITAWDEEVCVLAGKYSQDCAFVGTGRRQGLALGVNRKPSIEIDSDGEVAIKTLRVDRWRIGHTADTPGWSGTRGDIMFNSDPKPNSPLAWICLGAFKWQPVKVMP